MDFAEQLSVIALAFGIGLLVGLERAGKHARCLREVGLQEYTLSRALDGQSCDPIRCESKEGILTVHIPKSETQKQKPKHVSVQ
jgi:HSP20 family molecular chaperone IbpA